MHLLRGLGNYPSFLKCVIPRVPFFVLNLMGLRVHLCSIELTVYTPWAICAFMGHIFTILNGAQVVVMRLTFALIGLRFMFGLRSVLNVVLQLLYTLGFCNNFL